MNTTELGKQAEQVAAKYLQAHGYRILHTNWKTKQCEIDIVAQKGDCVSYIEVKYRATDIAGSGLDYITHRKKQQMDYAARIWVQENQWNGAIALEAVEVADAICRCPYTSQILTKD